MTTALVTGASSGLGEGFARQLAAENHNLVLTARRADRLDALAAELRAQHKIRVETVALDLGEPAAVDTLMAEVLSRGLAVELLVNNAGFGGRGDFAAMDRAAVTGMIDLNCRALTELCHAVLPAMLERKSGAILNIASTAAFQPGPWMAVYYASKAYVLSFSEALHEEVRGRGIRVSALCPGPTRTEFADRAQMHDSALFERFAGDAAAVVRDGLRAVEAGQAVRVSGAMNRVMAESNRFAPRAMVRKLAGALQKTREG